MKKKSEKLLTKKRYKKTYRSYQAAADDAGVTKQTAMNTIKMEETPTLRQITLYKVQHGYYQQHPIIVYADSTSTRTVEGMETISLIVVIRFPHGKVHVLEKEVVINKLLYNEKADTIMQVIKAELLDVGLVLDERDILIMDGAKELRKGFPGVLKNVKIQGCLVHLKRLLDDLFKTSDTAKEWTDEGIIEVRDEFKRLIRRIARAKNQAERNCSISELENKLESKTASFTDEMRGFWRRFKKDLDAGFYHTLDETPFYEIFRIYGEDVRDNNVAEAECKKDQKLRKDSNGFKKHHDTQDLFNSDSGADRLPGGVVLKREPEFKPTYCWHIPLQLGALDLVDTTDYTKLYQIPEPVLKDAAERFHRIEVKLPRVKSFSFLSSALPSFARELQEVVEELSAKLNIPYDTDSSVDPLSRKHRFPTLSNEVATDEKTLQAFKEALDKLQAITRRYSGNYVVKPYKEAVEVLKAVTGIDLKHYYQLSLRQGYISDHCPRHWNFARKRLKLQTQLEEHQNADGIEFMDNGAAAYITDPDTAAAKMLISNSGLDKPEIQRTEIFVEALRRNKRLTGHNRVRIGEGIYDTDLLARVIPSDALEASLHQSGGKDMPLGVKIGEHMGAVSPMVIIGTNAEKTYLETPSLTDLVANYFFKRDYKRGKPRFSLSQWGPPKPVKEPRQIGAVQLNMFGTPCYNSKRFSLADWGKNKQPKTEKIAAKNDSYWV